jgi:hypothetical protein
MLVSVSLPQTMTERRLVVKPGVLLRPGNELPAVRVIGLAFDQQVQMVRHEAVRNNCEPKRSRCSLDLRTHEVHGGRRYEQAIPLVRAECEEVLVKTEVIERLQVFGVHAGASANDGPPEGGPHVCRFA